MDIDSIIQQVDSYFEQNKGEEAEKLMRESIVQAVAEADDGSLLKLLNELLGYYRETGRAEESYVIADRAVAQAKSMGLEDTLPYATTLLNVANAYRAGGRLEESLAHYRKVYEIYRKVLPPDDMLMASFENNLSLLCQETGDFKAAKEALLKALAIVEKREAGYEIAVTYANLANTCVQLGESGEAYQYAQEAIRRFEKAGSQDSHYGAALSALGLYYYQRQEYAEAADYFRRAMETVEQSLGRNAFWYRLKENYEACGARLNRRGLELCRAYYETYGRSMIKEQFPEYEDKIAVGLVGEGSDCFGYDDALSRDHDWGPDFCMWVTGDTYEKIGTRLQQAYEKLPGSFQGFSRTTSKAGVGRRGVQVIEAFYERLTGAGRADEIDWRQASDAGLAAAVNGEVFRDKEGIFTENREELRKGYPPELLYLKLAEAAAGFSQAGQYNFERMCNRQDVVTAQLLLADCIRQAMKLKHYLEGKYPPHDKWLYRSLKELPGGEALADMLQRMQTLSGGETLFARQEEIRALVEEAGGCLAEELYRKNYISDTDRYLDAHTEELLKKSVYAARTKEELVEQITALEFEAFDKVQNEGGRAECQNNWATFSIMRKSQYLAWDKPMLIQYLYDFDREYRRGHNLITEKYGRMMESTAPMEYERLKAHFPALSQEKKAIIEQIAGVQVGWMEEFAAKYPHLADHARSIRAEQDNAANTSYETYLKGELGTYSDKMLELYGRFIVSCAREGRNLAGDIMNNSVHLYGYKDLEAAENFYRTFS
ncbi:MAG: DUF4125 family protein [Roseburia sp.]|nr:DUF4125 family protein [Roseburia sp.]